MSNIIADIFTLIRRLLTPAKSTPDTSDTSGEKPPIRYTPPPIDDPAPDEREIEDLIDEIEQAPPQPIPERERVLPIGDDDTADAPAMTCSLPPDINITSYTPYEDIPAITTDAQAFTFGVMATLSHDDTPAFHAQTPACTVKIRPELGTVNLRVGPGVHYDPPLATTRGGVVYELVGASAPDRHDLRWYAVNLGTTSGWVRSDMVILSIECAEFSFIEEDEVAKSIPKPIENRFDLPAYAPITQRYRPPHHLGIDLDTPTGTQIITPAEGVCLRRIKCTKCTPARPNRYPNADFQCPDTWNDPEWGYGYGNFIIMRHDYAHLPADMRDEMDKRNLTNGFAYILYAHLDQVNIQEGEQIAPGKVIATTGNTGCSAAPHLHFEVKIGKDESIDNRWSAQQAIHPKYLFKM